MSFMKPVRCSEMKNSHPKGKNAVVGQKVVLFLHQNTLITKIKNPLVI